MKSPGKISTRSAGFLLNRFGLLAVVTLLVLEAWTRQSLIVIFWSYHFSRRIVLVVELKISAGCPS